MNTCGAVVGGELVVDVEGVVTSVVLTIDTVEFGEESSAAVAEVSSLVDTQETRVMTATTPANGPRIVTHIRRRGR